MTAPPAAAVTPSAHWDFNFFASATARTPPTVSDEGLAAMFAALDPMDTLAGGGGGTGGLFFASAARSHVTLPNYGSTCFVNAALQVLLRVEPFAARVEELALQYGFFHPDKEEALRLLWQHASAFRGGPRADTERLADRVRSGTFGLDFTGAGTQCDAFDFMRETLHFLDEQHLSGTFGCGIRARGRCVHCVAVKDMSSLEPYLSLQLPEGSSATALPLRALWERCFEENPVQPDAKCPSLDVDKEASCSGPVARQLFLEREPPVLLLRIERGCQFRDPRTGSILREGKNPRPVDFPACLDFLRTGPYALRGVVCHHGPSLSRGHYTAFCWLREDTSRGDLYGVFDDDKAVKELAWHECNQKFLRANCYALLYVRTGRWADAPLTGVEATPYLRGPVTDAFLASRCPASPLDAVAADAEVEAASRRGSFPVPLRSTQVVSGMADGSVAIEID